MWVESLNTRDNERAKTRRSCQQHKHLTLHDLRSTGRHFSEFCFTRNTKSNSCAALTTQNNCNITYAQKNAALQPNVLNWNTSVKGKDKGKVHPITDHAGPEGA